jgi:predicted nucleic-acid-binding protein
MKVGLDISVVLRLLLGEPADQSARAVAFLDELSRGGHDAVISDLVAAGVYFALQHHYDVSKHDALQGLRDLFDAGEIKPLGAIAGVLATRGLASAKPGFVDRLIHGAYAEVVDEMVTFEKAAARLKSVRVL